MKIYLTDDQINQVIKELDKAKQEAFDVPKEDAWGVVYANDKVEMLKETLSRGFVILSIEY